VLPSLLLHHLEALLHEGSRAAQPASSRTIPSKTLRYYAGAALKSGLVHGADPVVMQLERLLLHFPALALACSRHPAVF